MLEGAKDKNIKAFGNWLFRKEPPMTKTNDGTGGEMKKPEKYDIYKMKHGMVEGERSWIIMKAIKQLVEKHRDAPKLPKK